MTNIITPDTTKEDVVKDYTNYPSTMTDLSEKPFYESRLAPIFFEVRRKSKVLDVGCNDGVFMQMLKERRECDVMGIDISETALDEARKRGLNVMSADVEKLPFEDNTFDYVICMEVLSHLFDPAKALSEIRRVLKKNGALLGSCPHKNLETYAWEDKRMHRRYFDLDALHTLLSESFGRNWIKVLNGAQFAMSMAHSFLADQPAAMLFKSGGDDLKGWNEALQDTSVLRCWFGFTQTPGTVYYRMSGYADHMQKLGAEVHYNPYDETDFNSPQEWCQKIKYIPSERRLTNAHMVNELESLLKAADMSVFQVTSSRDIVLVLTTAKLGVIKKPMWVEIDDWIFDIPSYNIASGPYSPNSEAESVAFDQIKLSDGIICSTEYLKEKLAQLFPDKKIYVVKNSLDFNIWDNVKRPTTLHNANPDLIRIGYTGCGNHSGDLELIREPIRALLDEFKNLEFISLPYPSTDDISNPRFKRVDRWVSLSKYPQAVADWELDIGLAPLRDNDLNRSKSNLRWLEYSALKIPTIASKVYPFEHSISHNRDGILVGNSPKDWYEAMRALIFDMGKRTAIGEKAYRKVKRHYSMDDVARSYLSILREIKRDFIGHMGGVRSAS